MLNLQESIGLAEEFTEWDATKASIVVPTDCPAPPTAPKADVPPPRWGGNNATLAWSASVAMTDKADAPLHPTWEFEYYYDWTKKASRYEHAAGQHDEVKMVHVLWSSPGLGLKGFHTRKPSEIPQGNLFRAFQPEEF